LRNFRRDKLNMINTYNNSINKYKSMIALKNTCSQKCKLKGIKLWQISFLARFTHSKPRDFTLG